MSDHKRILVVEDEEDLLELIGFNLRREGYTCRVARRGDDALNIVRAQPPDLIILDRMLPGLSGDDVAAQLKRQPALASVPILMLTAKSEETDQLVGFALGADDYVTKPFSMKLLLARVSSLLRRSDPRTAEAEERYIGGTVELVPARHEATLSGEPLPLTATEFRLLHALMAARGRVLTRSQLIDKALGADAMVTDRTIDVHVTGLRRKLGPAAAWVKTVRTVGYTFRAPSGTDSGEGP
jgi:two-component system phosphate regulon response regulator PhoB